jgi:outer membrane cobalamin receptor
MKEWRWLIVALTIICFAAPHVAEAGQASSDLATLPEIVVTATKTEKKVEDAPGA